MHSSHFEHILLLFQDTSRKERAGRRDEWVKGSTIEARRAEWMCPTTITTTSVVRRPGCSRRLRRRRQIKITRQWYFLVQHGHSGSLAEPRLLAGGCLNWTVCLSLKSRRRRQYSRRNKSGKLNYKKTRWHLLVVAAVAWRRRHCRRATRFGIEWKRKSKQCVGELSNVAHLDDSH